MHLDRITLSKSILVILISLLWEILWARILLPLRQRDPITLRFKLSLITNPYRIPRMRERNNFPLNNVKIPFCSREEDLTQQVAQSILKVWLSTTILSNFKTPLAPVRTKEANNIKNLASIYMYLDRWWTIEVNSCSIRAWWDIPRPLTNKQKNIIYSWLQGKHQDRTAWKRLRSSLKDKNFLPDLSELDLHNYAQIALLPLKDRMYLQIK